MEIQTQHADRAELYIGLMKIGVGKDIQESNYPMRLWYYACERRSSVMTINANNLYMSTLGEMGDISNLCKFGWYEWVYFRQNTASFPCQKKS